MEIRSLHVDFDKDILEINGKPYERPTIVSLPHVGGWKRRKGFNFAPTEMPKDYYDRLDVSIKFGNQ